VTAAEVEAAARSMSPGEYAQEFLAGFSAASGKVYTDFSLDPWPLGNLDGSAEDDGTSAVLVGHDPGMRAGVVCAVKAASGDLLVFDAEEVRDSHTGAIAARLRERFRGRRVIVHPDPAGQQRRSSAAHLTDFTILRQAGLEVVAPRAAPLRTPPRPPPALR